MSKPGQQRTDLASTHAFDRAIVGDTDALLDGGIDGGPNARQVGYISRSVPGDPMNETDAIANSAAPRARELYLDLLIEVLLNMIYEDSAIKLGFPQLTAEPFNPETRAIGQDLPTQAHTMVGRARLENLRKLSQQALDDGIAGDFIETGVWRGGCCILMRGILAANQICDRRVYVADSFAGLPAPNDTLYPADTGWDLSPIKELAVALETVKANFARYGLLDEQLVFVEGLFSETLPSLSAGPFALMRLDGDLYESTYVALNSLYSKLSPGGFIVIDDHALDPCKRAVADFRSRFGITAPVHEIDWTGIWWRKE